MKLKLPLALLASLTACMVYAQDSYSYTELDQVPVYDTVVGSDENDYTVRIVGSNGSCYDVNAKNVTWDSSHTYPKGHVLSVGSILTESTLNIVTPEGAQKETVVETGQNLFIGGWGWGISSTDNLTPLTGKVVVKDATLLVTPNSGGDSSCSQLNVGQAGNYAQTGCEGFLEVDNGTVRAGAINVGMSRDTMGTVTVKNGGVLIAERRGDTTSAYNYTGSLYVGNNANSAGEVTIEGNSTLTVDKSTYVGVGSDDVSGAATGTLTVRGESTADLGMLVVGYSNSGTKGTVTVDDSTLTAGTTYLGYESDTSGSLTVSNGSTATLGNAYLGYYGGSEGDITVNTGASATMQQTLVGYYDGTTGEVTVDGGTLTTGNTWVGGSGNGELLVDNAGQATLDYLCVGGSVTIEDGSSAETIGSLVVKSGAALAVTDGVNADGTDAASSLKVGAALVNDGTITADLSKGGSLEAISMDNAGEMEVSLANGGSVSAVEVSNSGTMTANLADGASYNATFLNNTGTTTVNLAAGGCFETAVVDNTGTLTVTVGNGASYEAATVNNSGTMDIELKEGAAMVVDTYVNAGDSTITAAEGTTCQISSLDLSGGSMKLDGDGEFNLGGSAEGENGLSSTFHVSGLTTTTNIDISSLVSESVDNLKFTINDKSVFTLNFTAEALANIKEGEEATFTLTLVAGYEGFSVEEGTLSYLLDNNTRYVFETALAFAADASAGAADYVVKDAQYLMVGNDLVWTGSVKGIPEPATATLSLLALTALTARRRRGAR